MKTAHAIALTVLTLIALPFLIAMVTFQVYKDELL